MQCFDRPQPARQHEVARGEIKNDASSDDAKSQDCECLQVYSGVDGFRKFIASLITEG
jgi:hypothetical protein